MRPAERTRLLALKQVRARNPHMHTATHKSTQQRVHLGAGVFFFSEARLRNDKLQRSRVDMLRYNDRSVSKQHSEDRLYGEAAIIRTHTHT